MIETTVDNKFTVFSREIMKADSPYESVGDILDELKERIDLHPVAKFIDIFDHMSHTEDLPDGQIDPSIIDAKIIIFCFGKIIKSPLTLALRPRSIGVAELNDRFVLSLYEAPNERVHETICTWVKEISAK